MDLSLVGGKGRRRASDLNLTLNSSPTDHLLNRLHHRRQLQPLGRKKQTIDGTKGIWGSSFAIYNFLFLVEKNFI